MHKLFLILSISLLTLLLVSSVALAQDAPADDTAVDDTSAPTPEGKGTFVIGLHVGPNIQGAFSPLKVFVQPRLEIGANLPFLAQRFYIFGTAAYTAPTAEGTVPDTRVPDGEFSWDLTQTELMFGLGVHFRFLPNGTIANPYLGAGPQIYLLRTRVDGRAGGQEFGTNIEKYTKIGAYAAVGVEISLGPGSLFVQGTFGWARLDRQITGRSNTGSITPSVGYRLMLF